MNHHLLESEYKSLEDGINDAQNDIFRLKNVIDILISKTFLSEDKRNEISAILSYLSMNNK